MISGEYGSVFGRVMGASSYAAGTLAFTYILYKMLNPIHQ